MKAKGIKKTPARSVSAKEKKAVAGQSQASLSKSSGGSSSGGQQKGGDHWGSLDRQLLLKMHDLMVKSRVLEERLIKMYKTSNGYFWIGGPGEEATNVSLGLLIKKGQGLDHDFMHFHYRNSATMVAMGMDPIESIRQMKNVATDPFSGGRNFSNHYSRREWNVVPVTSTIETQHLSAIGTGLAHKRHGGSGITIVTGGDAGTAEGDFASCLVWASRPGNELPMLIMVTNNEFGISTPGSTQRPHLPIADRAIGFGMAHGVINGNDVVEAYEGIKKAMDYVRKERKPFLLECRVSRLYGHSSASGANLVTEEVDCITQFEKRLESSGFLSRKQMDDLRAGYEKEMLEMTKKVLQEPMPDPDSIYDYTFYGQRGKYWK